MLKQLTCDNFENEIKTGLKVVEFYATWCGYCTKQEQELNKLQDIQIEQVNVDENTDLAIKFKVNAFPTFLIFKNGKEMERFSGFRTKEELLNTLTKYL